MSSDNRQVTWSNPKVILFSLMLTGSILTSLSVFNRYFKRYESAKDIPSHIFKKSFLKGKVTSVGDGDNFHFYHTPGGVLGGWGWLRETPSLIALKPDSPLLIQTKKTSKQKQPFFSSLLHKGPFKLFSTQDPSSSEYFMNLSVPYKNRRGLDTISVRLSGVDAPERSHFGNKAQPFSEEALIWLKHTLIGKTVWIKPLSIDQYGRCVARTVYWNGLFKGGYKDVSLEMIQVGLGTVYEGSEVFAEFDGQEVLYRYHERLAKSRKKGIWGLKKFETPGQYKKRTKA